jgi:hypothetical protein
MSTVSSNVRRMISPPKANPTRARRLRRRLRALINRDRSCFACIGYLFVLRSILLLMITQKLQYLSSFKRALQLFLEPPDDPVDFTHFWFDCSLPILSDSSRSVL